MLPLNRILCPVDFSDFSYSALEAAAELGVHFYAELFVVHVVAPVPIVSAPAGQMSFNVPLYQEELKTSSQQALEEVIEKSVPAGVKAHPMVAMGEPATEIVRLADEHEVDLIVISSHGMTGWRHLIFGSVAEKIIRHTAKPILSIPAPRD